MSIKIPCTLSALLIFTISSFSQSSISGKVVDTYEQQPLVGTQIILQSIGQVTVTDEAGFFELTSEKENDVVIFRYLGFEEKRMEISNSTTDLGTIELVRANTTLDEVIVSASPNSYKSGFKGSNFRIDPIALKNINPLSTEEVLKSVPGVNIVGDGSVQSTEYQHTWLVGKKVKKSIAYGRWHSFRTCPVHCSGPLLQPCQ